MIITGSKCQIEFCKWTVKPQQFHFLQCCMKPFIHSFIQSFHCRTGLLTTDGVGLFPEERARQLPGGAGYSPVQTLVPEELQPLPSPDHPHEHHLLPPLEVATAHRSRQLPRPRFESFTQPNLLSSRLYHVPGSSPSLNQIFYLLVSTTSQVRVLHSTKSFLFSSLQENESPHIILFIYIIKCLYTQLRL